MLFLEEFNHLKHATMDISKKWTQPLRIWKKSISQFAIYFEERLKTELAI
jgi:transposase-like protein